MPIRPRAAQITLTAKIAVVAPGGGIPGGTVTFKNGTATLGTAPVTNVGGIAEALFPVSSLRSALIR